MNIRKLSLGLSGIFLSVAAGAQTFTVQNLQVNGTTNANDNITLAKSSPQFTINDTSASNQGRINFQSNGTLVWGLVKNAGTTGSLSINRYNSGSLVDSPIAISNSTGVSTFTARPVFGANTPWDSGNLAQPATLNAANTFTVSPQTLATASGTAALVVQGVSGTSRELDFQTGSNLRWKFQASNAAESGSNVGSDLAVGRYNDAGTFVDNPFVITRSTGLTTIGILTVSGNLTPSQTNGIVGTTTNNNANAGSVGEYTTATNTATALTTATAANCTSVSLTAGDWDVQSVIMFTPTGTTSLTDALAGVSTVSATGGALGTYTKNTWAASVLNNNVVISSPVVRVSLAGTTTVYAIGRSTFTASTLTCDGFIRARRVR